MSSDTIPLHGRVDVRALFEGEWWWTVRHLDGTENGTLYDFGYDSDNKRARQAAKEAAQRLSRELGYA